MGIRKIGKALFDVGLMIACVCFLIYVFAGLWLSIAAASNIIREPTVLAIAIVCMFGGVGMMMLGHFLDRLGLILEKRKPGVGRELDRLTPEKPEGWNRDVLWWFHNGPELRTKGDEFDEGFNRAAKLPPVKRK